MKRIISAFFVVLFIFTLSTLVKVDNASANVPPPVGGTMIHAVGDSGPCIECHDKHGCPC